MQPTSRGPIPIHDRTAPWAFASLLSLPWEPLRRSYLWEPLEDKLSLENTETHRNQVTVIHIYIYCIYITFCCTISERYPWYLWWYTVYLVLIMGSLTAYCPHGMFSAGSQFLTGAKCAKKYGRTMQFGGCEHTC